MGVQRPALDWVGRPSIGGVPRPYAHGGSVVGPEVTTVGPNSHPALPRHLAGMRTTTAERIHLLSEIPTGGACDGSSSGRAAPCQGAGGGFEPRSSLSAREARGCGRILSSTEAPGARDRGAVSSRTSPPRRLAPAARSTMARKRTMGTRVGPARRDWVLMAAGVIGSTSDSGSERLGSNPGWPALRGRVHPAGELFGKRVLRSGSAPPPTLAGAQDRNLECPPASLYVRVAKHGRRARLRIWCPLGREGSTPSLDTTP